MGVEVKETSQESACHTFCARHQAFQRSERHPLNFAPIPSKTAWREEAGPARQAAFAVLFWTGGERRRAGPPKQCTFLGPAPRPRGHRETGPIAQGGPADVIVIVIVIVPRMTCWCAWGPGFPQSILSARHGNVIVCLPRLTNHAWDSHEPRNIVERRRVLLNAVCQPRCLKNHSCTRSRCS